ncbi:putative bifunctional diguanylate cyclase/phosphodiesterase [Endothiovibrio diazotrophicus]
MNQQPDTPPQAMGLPHSLEAGEIVASLHARVDTLATPIVPVSPHHPCLGVLKRFQENPSLHLLPVADGDKPVGLVLRASLIEEFSKPYSRDLNHKRTIAEFVEENTLFVEHEVSIDDLARMIIESGHPGMADGFIVTDHGRYQGVGTYRDVLNELAQRRQEHLFHLAHYDALTGLPNRLLFQDRLVQACARAARGGDKVALLFLDLDGFKYVNDTLGHAVGDRLLREIARRLGETVRRSDTLARLGGDEFTAILTGLAKKRAVVPVANKMLQEIARPIELPGIDEKLRVTASIGIAFYPSDSKESSSLVRKADMAMYQAKESGRNNYQFYAQATNLKIRDRLSLEHDLRVAVEQRELILHYQPVVDGDGLAVGVEALLRWPHRERGMVPPDQFIPLAEETGLIEPIGQQVIDLALRDFAGWRSQGIPPLSLAINLSVRQLERSEIVKQVVDRAAEYGIELEQLIFEVTEGVMIRDGSPVAKKLAALDALGARLAVDDFGTGYSSLSYLQSLPFSTLKIDKRFVAKLHDDNASRSLSKAIVAMAHSLGLSVIAEGVENAEQLAVLRGFGCHHFQGYHFARPMPPEEVLGYLRRY